MLGIKLVCVGKLKERFYTDAQSEYIKRLGAYCNLEIEELPECRTPAKPSQKELEAALFTESAAIEAKLPGGAFLTALCVEGKTLSSAAFSELLSGLATAGRSRLCFVIGGSNGLNEGLKEKADLRLSLSEMTFPHNLARVILLEQLYRGFKIAGGGKYHK